METQKQFLLLLVGAVAFSGLSIALRKRRNETSVKSLKAAADIITAAKRKPTATSLFVQPANHDPKAPSFPKAVKPKHALVVNAISPQELKEVFDKGVLRCYRETQLPSYSRYEKWTQSCYMEVDEKWTPRPTINLPLFESFRDIQEKCRLIFAQWYAEL